MISATRIFVSTFGSIMAFAGIEHGIGEILQGNTIPDGVMIESWFGSEFFRNLSGEPAMTLIPNFLVSGIMTVLVSLALLVWAICFVERKHSGWIMILISIALLLVGGGLFPPFFGILIGSVAIKIHAPLNWWCMNRLVGIKQILVVLFPWTYTACVLSWFAMIPGLGILDTVFGVNEDTLILGLLVLALSTLLLTMISAFARDSRLREKPEQTA